MADKNIEYASLREELLEYWKIQEKLIYAAIAIIGVTFVEVDKLVEVADKRPDAPILLMVFLVLNCLVYVIASRLWVNYHRIYRIGAYLRVFHDDVADNKGDSRARWHDIWRSMDENEETRERYALELKIGSLAPQNDFWILLLILVFGGFLCVFLEKDLIKHPGKILLLLLNGGVLLFSCKRFYDLFNAYKCSGMYVKAFTTKKAELSKGLKEPQSS